MTNVMASFEHTVSRNLQCPICFDLLSDPKQLSCTHTFCKKCLGDILASQNQANTVRCPICRSTTDVKDGNVENLNTNVPLKSLIDDVRNCKQLCEMCDKKLRAVRFCCDCGMHFCNACLERHNNWPAHLNHKVVSVEDIREGKVVIEKVYCQEHVHKTGRLEDVFVCTTCKKLICTRCRMINHTKEKGHTVQDAEEYNASIKTEIESLLNRGKAKVTVIRSHMTFVESQVKRVTEHIEQEKSKLNHEYEELTNRLSERRVGLHQQLEAQKREFCQKLKNMKGADERSIASVESASELVGHSLKAPLAGDIIAIRDSLSAELKNVLDEDDPEKKLAIYVADHAEQLKFTLGHRYEWLSIGRQASRFGFCSVFFLLLSLVLFEFMSSLARSQINLRCEVEFLHGGLINSMTATPDGRMAVGYIEVGRSLGGIAFYSADGQLQQTVLKNVRVRDIGFLSDGRCVVLSTQSEIMLYTSTWVQLYSSESLRRYRGRISSLTVDSDDQIYVSYQKAKKILVFSPAGGKAIRKIPCDGYVPNQIISYFNVLIVEMVKNDENEVVIMDGKGQIKHELTKSEGTYLYAAVSNSNSVLIASVRHEEGLLSIDEYTSEFKHMTNLISDFKIEKPVRNWYYLQQFQSGEIVFCTLHRLYIFH